MNTGRPADTVRPYSVRFTHAQAEYIERFMGENHTFFAKVVDDAFRTYFTMHNPSHPWPQKYGIARAA